MVEVHNNLGSWTINQLAFVLYLRFLVSRIKYQMFSIDLPTMCMGSSPTILGKWIHYDQEVKQARKDILPSSGTYGRFCQESNKIEAEWSNFF